MKNVKENPIAITKWFCVNSPCANKTVKVAVQIINSCLDNVVFCCRHMIADIAVFKSTSPAYNMRRFSMLDMVVLGLGKCFFV